MFINVWQWLEDGAIAVAIRQSLWLYPVLEIVHIVGIVLLVGPAFMFDLRLLGFAKKLPVAALRDNFLPWSERALLLVIPSGLFLFATNAATLAYDAVFWVKMILLVAAGLNATIFHRLTFIRVPSHDENMRLPAAAKVAAIASIVLWLSIITCGRLLAY